MRLNEPRKRVIVFLRYEDDLIAMSFMLCPVCVDMIVKEVYMYMQPSIYLSIYLSTIYLSDFNLASIPVVVPAIL